MILWSVVPWRSASTLGAVAYWLISSSASCHWHSAVECNCKNNNYFWNTCANLRLFLFFCRKRSQTHQNAEVKPEESCQQGDKWQHQTCSRKKVFSRKKSQCIILQPKYRIISLIFNTLVKWDFSKKWREKYHRSIINQGEVSSKSGLVLKKHAEMCLKYA